MLPIDTARSQVALRMQRTARSTGRYISQPNLRFDEFRSAFGSSFNVIEERDMHTMHTHSDHHLLSNLQVLAENLRAPRFASQARQARNILTRLPPTHRTRRRDLHTIDLLDPPTAFASLRSTLDILVLARQCSLATLNLRARSRGLDILRASLESLQQCDYAFGCEVFVVIVVNLNHRRVDACSETLDFDEGKEPVFRRVAGRDSEVVLDGLDDLVAAAASELTWGLFTPISIPAYMPSFASTYRRADLQVPLPNRIPIVHGVERRNLIHPHWRDLQYPRNLIHHAQARESMLSLSEVEDGHHGRLLVLGWVALEDLFDELIVLLCELEGDVRVVFGGITMLRLET